MGLSSNVLWHQTSKDGFFKILKSRRILYSYSLENSFSSMNGIQPETNESLAFPMISLSDIPICEMPHNKWAYGNYAIGLSREWSTLNKFTPVWYCEPNSAAYKLLNQLAIKAIIDGDMKRAGNYLYMLSYMKFIQGPLPRRGYKNYRFYDEREYRLIPLKEEWDNKFNPILFEKDYYKYKKEHNDSSLLDVGVTFTPNDVRYLIVNSEYDKRRAEKLLMRNDDAAHIHIFTKSQILEDFIGIEHNVKY